MGALLTDYLGQAHAPTEGARILSLVPSLTELLFDLDLADHLVGRTHYCIHPARRVPAVPSVGGTKKIKMDRVRALAPTHALLNVDENPRDMADALVGAGIDVIVTHPQHPDDNPALYTLIGGVFGRAAQAATLADEYRRTRARVGEPASWPAKRVLYLIWKDPWMAIQGETYIGGCLGLVNWHTVAPGADQTLTGDAARYPEITLDEATLSNVDLVLFSSEPYAFTGSDIAEFKEAHPAHAQKAHLIDGEMTSWYGSRAIRGLDYIATFASGILR